jgi:hypothetical protein
LFIIYQKLNVDFGLGVCSNYVRFGGEGVKDLLRSLGICSIFALKRGRGVKKLEKMRTYFVEVPIGYVLN